MMARGPFLCSSAQFGFTNMDFDAPVRARHEIEVFAPPEMVWDWLSRVELWADWHPEIVASAWLGESGLRGSFKYRVRKVLPFRCRVEVWRESREIAWASGNWFWKTRHAFHIRGDFRRTTIISEAWADGPVPSNRLSRGMFLDELNRVVETGLGALKTRLEREKRDESSRPVRPMRRARGLDLPSRTPPF